MQELYTFKVKGVGWFPIDMLRYDRCFPTSQMDAGRIQASLNGILCGGEVGLTGLKPPTRDRWQSFLWKVIEE